MAAEPPTAKKPKFSRGASFASVLDKFPPNSELVNKGGQQYTNDFGRPGISISSETCPLVFQAMHFEEDSGLLRIYGASEHGSTVMLTAHDFRHYFYFPAPKGFGSEDLPAFREYLNTLLKQNPAVDEVGLHRKKTKHGTVPETFLKINVPDPSMLAPLKNKSDLFGKCEYRGLFNSLQSTYENDVPFVMRFMLDTGIVPMTWVKVQEHKYMIMDETRKVSYCQLEALASYEDIAIAPRTDLPEMVPLRVLSIDIETMVPPSMKMPHPTSEELLQIACTVSRRSSYASKRPVKNDPPFVRCIFSLKSCADINNCQVFTFEDEEELLKAWRQFILDIDPDVIVGYNLLRFDIPFLLIRAKHLGVPEFGCLGRMKDRTTKYKKRFNPNEADWASGPNFSGRLTIDVFHWVKRNLKYTVDGSHRLGFVANQILGESKEEVNFREIPDLQNGDDEDRRFLAVYCLKDAYLAQELCDKVDCLGSYLGTARQYHIPINWGITRESFIDIAKRMNSGVVGEYIVADVF